MKSWLVRLLLVAWFFVAAAPAANAQLLELAAGDRVVLLGSALVEREQNYGLWEAMLVSHFPDRNIAFHNLGRSGDTVWAEKRAVPASAGLAALREQLQSLKPTVLLVAYGADEAAAGEAGLSRFQAGLRALLDLLETTKAKVILLAPLKIEHMSAEQADPEAANKKIWHYRDAIHEESVRRDLLFLDLDRWLEELRWNMPGPHTLPPLTTDGALLSEWGYWIAAAGLENELQLRPSGWSLELDAKGKVLQRSRLRFTLDAASETKLAFAITADSLPLTAALRQPNRAGTLRVQGLPDGKYILRAGEQELAKATAEEWARGLAIDNPAEDEQVDQLRRAIVEKNKCLRQGAEASAKLTESQQQIARLRVPQAQHYELVRESSDR